jgi:hypothetical protein
LKKIPNTVGFGLPAFRTELNVTVCKAANICKDDKLCYGMQGCYNFSSVQNNREFNYYLSTSMYYFDKFLTEDLKKLVYKYKVQYVRIHDVGDFTNINYFNIWLKACKTFKEAIFYTYTKMIPFIRKQIDEIKEINNFRFCQSEGGIYDKDIDYSLPWSRIFISKEHIQKAIDRGDIKYDGSVTDQYCIDMKTGGIGFVYHGNKKLTPEMMIKIENNTNQCELNRKSQENL